MLFSSALASPGEPLDAATRAFMEPRLGFGTENYAIIRTATEAHVVVRIHLVEAARPKLEQIRELGDVTHREALAGVSEDEGQCLLRTLEAMKANLTEA